MAANAMLRHHNLTAGHDLELGDRRWGRARARDLTQPSAAMH